MSRWHTAFAPAPSLRGPAQGKMEHGRLVQRQTSTEWPGGVAPPGRFPCDPFACPGTPPRRTAGLRSGGPPPETLLLILGRPQGPEGALGKRRPPGFAKRPKHGRYLLRYFVQNQKKLLTKSYSSCINTITTSKNVFVQKVRDLLCRQPSGMWPRPPE